jgi:oligopeptidase A
VPSTDERDEPSVWTDRSLDLPQLPPDEILQRTAAAITRANRTLDAAVVAANDPSAPPPTFEAFFGALDAAAREVAWAYGHGAGRAGMTSDDAARAASFDALEQIEKWRASLPLRLDLAEALERFVGGTDVATLAPDERALVARWQKDIRLAGGTLPAADRAEVARLGDRLVELATEFTNNLATPPHLEVARGDLEGVPEAISAAQPAGTRPGTIDLVLNEPTCLAILQRCRNRALRERVFRVWNRKGDPANLELLEEVLQTRRRLAQLLGYASWQALRSEDLAAGSGSWIDEFIDAMSERLAPIMRLEYAAMLAVLRSEPGAPADIVLQDWDWRYADQLERAAMGAHPEELVEYLELEQVLGGLAELSDEVFGLRLESRPERTGWHPDVRPADLIDSGTGNVLAHVFMDVFARNGNQTGAWADVMLPGRPGEPITLALVMNAPVPGDGPSLLSVDDVDTLFHEYGHVMNFACGRGRFVLHREHWLPFDFIEGPSSFQGRWSRRPQVMARFGRHHAAGEPIPDGLFQALVRSEALNQALHVQRLLSLGRLDALLHGPEPIPIKVAERRAYQLRELPFPEDTSLPASFNHIVAGGYSAAVYGYAWSELVRDDLLARFAEGGLLSPEMGARYRETILEVGWMDDPVGAVNAFLGRTWSPEAFLARAAAASEALA